MIPLQHCGEKRTETKTEDTGSVVARARTTQTKKPRTTHRKKSEFFDKDVDVDEYIPESGRYPYKDGAYKNEKESG